MKKLVIGILAHVDAGKTTLSESLLYLSGKIRKAGRVDNKDAFLDHFELERARGITIFSKQAIFSIGDTQITLLDTPGHVDFSTEMERTLQVLDYAILVISGADGIQGHTKTLWRLLDIYNIPVFLFINKMDQSISNKEKLLRELKKQMGDGCVDFGQTRGTDFYEQLAMCDEKLMVKYLENGHITDLQISEAIHKRKLFPCFFGSALKMNGVKEFLHGIAMYTNMPAYSEQFGAKIFKIERDEKGNRLTHMKITGGHIKVKDELSNGIWSEKVNQIRLYSGQKYEAVNEVEAGSVCAVTGLSLTKPGEGLGAEASSAPPVLEPVLTYQIILPEGIDPRVMLPKLYQIEEEDPGLHVVWDEQLKEIQVQIMGEVQVEILQGLIQSRFGISIYFDSGRVLYKETIADAVEGVGHFEPLRHYAEVHLLMEPGERGSGLHYSVDCSDDILAKNWKNLVLTHLKEKAHIGVLTGSPITDIKITLVSGKAHNKHTEGGDFREATWRAVRQGLKEAQSVLLEPYYAFELELPEKMVGRAMTDIDKMYGTCQISRIEGEIAVLEGVAPVVTFQNYQKDMITYTKGQGRLFYSLKGYDTCHNPEEVISNIGYDSERDLNNPTSSVFCANGAGFLVSWDHVKEHMHVQGYMQDNADLPHEANGRKPIYKRENWLPPEEVDRILNRTSFANQGKKSIWAKRKTTAESFHRSVEYESMPKEVKQEYLLVDGYNVIYAWPELKVLAEEKLENARSKLLDSLIKYQGIRRCQVILVFDAYNVQGHIEEIQSYGSVHVVYTMEAQTADQYIEKFAHDHQKKYDITVATSDGLQQIIIRGSGSKVMSARELIEEINRMNERVMQSYKEQQQSTRNYLEDALPDETKKRMDEFLK